MKITFSEGYAIIEGACNGTGRIVLNIEDYDALAEQMRLEDAKASIVEYLEERKDCGDEQDEKTRYFSRPMSDLLDDDEFLTAAAQDVIANETMDRTDEGIYRTIYFLLENQD